MTTTPNDVRAMIRPLYRDIRASELQAGDEIVTSRTSEKVLVKSITRNACPGTRGVHVNTTSCFDPIAFVTIVA